ncbi:DNA-binding transcriptional regulator, LysR family [Leifsonia sp. 98AMF]|uniref:LysR family transcriptional regulator n=1 Tax=unclassified Leifsonia TaxID=2663824 RepID=UPI00087CF447|nr:MULTISPECIES: LysR family transcriptional regulator [unclassified Leifsonia]SDH11295.1 DNA-binding transcriptional regulator, LysR family [Leifsonia sp. 197AMF]SDJ27438.1 DNA-binding transcriptional regulator, LysR family [Leifsonia sp. 466MF]SDK53867.1 DNA-binding transcriptional regulator, LysR family [Leifsonia sp. 157MF]SDN49473.1 DNA-binding transcriptional regulator, LysR family [Leifsonia sp. 509MF]SEN61061.1 DNA-binding transcriptional regulator, LysR family [Leifsonia sp. 467MF]
MPSLRALACLIAVADAGSITEAARSLYLSQPAVSHHLLQLEQEAGVALIVRETRGVRLTPAGRAALVEARRAVDAAGAALPAAAAAGQATGGTIRIGCAQSLVTVLAPVLVDWHRRRADVLLTLREFTTVEEVTAQLDGDEIDLVVMAGPAPARFVGTPLGDEEIVLVTSADHPLAASDRVERQALDGVSLVHYAAENSLSGWLDQAFARSGVRPTVIMRTAVTAAAPQLAAAGLGVAVCPASAVPAGLPGAVLSFSPTWTRELVATTRTAPDGLVAHLVADIRDRIASSPQDGRRA